ncbi:MAG: hypothetical protein KDB18_12650 [Salinibacterium sp.]|nr:hypothetical protein [Salinibacterium sp.]
MFETLAGNRSGTLCLSKAGLAEGTNAATIKTAAPNGAGIDYAIEGILYHKADGDNVAMTATEQDGSTITVQPDLYTCLYLVQINAAGTISAVKGPQVLSADLAAGNAVLKWPTPLDGNCAIGAVKIVTDGGTFTYGTTDLSGTGVTDTWYDLFGIPARPLTS